MADISVHKQPELNIRQFGRRIIEHKKTERALAESESRFRKVVDCSPHAICLHRDHEFIYLNPAALNLYGVSEAEELIGKSIFDFIHPDYHERIKKRIRHIQGNGQRLPIQEQIYKRADGQTVIVEATAASIDIDGHPTILSLFTDITERKQAEQELKENEEKYRQLFEMESDAIFLIENETGKIIEVNPAGTDLYGYSREEFLTMDHTQVSAEPKNTRKATVEQRDNVPIRWHKKKDGTVFPVEITARHFIWKGKQVHIAAIRDIEFRLKAEEEKKQIESQLQQAQKMESIGTLASGIAHDFNNILGAIIGFTELSLMDSQENDSIQYNLEHVLQAASRAKDLIKQILTFSRQSKYDKKPIRIGPIIKETTKLVRASIPTTIEIHTDVSAGSDLVLANPTQLHQVIINLCSNAAHAIREKGGVLDLKLTEVELDAQSVESYPELEKGSYLKVEVCDTGCGISPGVINRIFDPFFTTKERGDGTGMGLATVHGIVNDHRGSIRVSSELGEGTIFDILLPKLEATLERRKEDEVTITGGNESVLLVDDEAVLIDTGKQMLERLGYEVTTRTSSLEALEAFRGQPNKIDLVITDMAMPNLNGVRLAKELLTIRSDIPIVLCTGYSDQIDEETASEVGIKAFVMKPVVINDLARVVRKVLDEVDGRDGHQLLGQDHVSN